MVFIDKIGEIFYFCWAEGKTMQKILIVEDDLGISESLKLYLENSNFVVDLYPTGENALSVIEESEADLVILDVNLPVMNGIEICSKLREDSDLPVIMLTARGWETDRITGLENGADDYIPKPFSPRELLARINVILRRSSKDDNEEVKNSIISFKHITLDTDKIILKVNDNEVSVTKNEYDILKKIIEEDGKVVSRETIMTEVIGYEKYMYDRTIDTHIKNLRKKIWDKEMILTVRGEWYRLNK